jgi:hypothetical protein
MLRGVKLGRRPSRLHPAPHLEVVGVSSSSGQRVVTGVGLWPWLKLAGRNGVPLERLAGQLGVSVAELRDPDGRFEHDVPYQLAELVCQHVGPHAGLAAALDIEAGQFALLELLARTAPSVGDAIAQGCRFFSLIFTPGGLDYEVLGDGAYVMRFTPPMDEAIHFGYIELLFGVWLVCIRREAGRPALLPREVWFCHRAPAMRELHDRVFGRVKFDMSEDRMVFDRSVVELALSRPNSEVHAAAVHSATALVDG